MTNLLITHNVQDEVRRVLYTISKIKWYEENGYKVDIPHGLDKNSTESEIIEKTTKEYSEGEYEIAASLLQKAWQDFLPRFEEVKNEKILTLNDLYTVKLTKYGTGGSYFPSESLIILKFKNKTPEQMFGTILHEMTHIGIESWIEEYKVGHWRKERLVDLIMQANFPNLKPFQTIPEDMQIVDDSFKANFPNLRKVTSSLAS